MNFTVYRLLFVLFECVFTVTFASALNKASHYYRDELLPDDPPLREREDDEEDRSS